MGSKKKIVLGAFVVAILSSVLTVTGLYLLLGLSTHKITDTMRFFGALRFIEEQYVNKVDDTKLIDGAIAGMVKSLDDPHSIYLNSAMYKDLMEHTEGSFGGIGVFMGFKDNVVTIVSVMESTPGADAGLQAGDEIVAVDGVLSSKMQPEETAMKIRGDAGTNVVLTIRRAGSADTDYTITRAVIKTHTVAHNMLPGDMGYIRIASFGENTSKEFREAYSDLEEKGMKGTILDLRGNPGGLVTSCVDIGNLLVPKGEIVSVVQRDGTKEEHMSSLEKIKYPLVVLIDGGSASAAEILAGAIQDTQAGTLVGAKSYGKGSVQVVMPMYEGDALKLTIAKYYTPSGRSIDGVGIEPDVAVAADPNGQKDTQALKAIEILKEKMQ
ncbi:MAG: S41 family peptidase [Selenomonadaceae bacterium]